MKQRTNSQYSNSQLRAGDSRMSVQSKSSKTVAGKKNFERFSKMNPEAFEEIENPEEREQAFLEAMEKMKKTIEDINVREAMNAKQIQRLKSDNIDLREKLDVLDIELKSTEKAKELDTNYLLQQEETLARSKYRAKEEPENPKLKKELKRIEEVNKKLKLELKENMNYFLFSGGCIEKLEEEISTVIEYIFGLLNP